jgi:hypothetical protein
MRRALLVPIAFIFTLLLGCTSGLQRPAAPSKPAVTAGSESLVISWDAVDGAASYSLYFTDDTSDPTTSTPSYIDAITDTSYTHQTLDPSKDYKYTVQAVGGTGAKSGLSPVSDPVKPNPRLTLNVTFPSFPNGQAAAILLDVPYDPVGGTPTGSPVLMQTLAAQTDGSGIVTFVFDIDHTKYWGYTVFKDNDGSGTITTGDTVWGNGGAGTYTYKYMTALCTSSVTRNIPNWEDAIAVGEFHTY